MNSEIHLISWWVGFGAALLGSFFSVLSGRGLARRMHDLRLAGESINVFSFGVMMYVFYGLLGLAMNLSSILLFKALGFFLGGVARGFDFIDSLISLTYSLLLVTLSYWFFSRRYRGVKRPFSRFASVMGV